MIKYILILVMLTASIILMAGCSDSPNDPSKKFTVNIPYKVVPYEVSCEDFYLIYARDSTDDRISTDYYWAGLKNVTKSEWVILSDTGKQADVFTNYFDMLIGLPIKTGHQVNSSDYYEVRVFRCAFFSEIGDTSEVDLFGLSPQFRFTDLTAWGPDDSCDTKCCTEGPKYSQFVHFVDDAIMVESRIGTQYGHLCGWRPPPAQGAEIMSASFAYCSIGKEVNSKTKWGQSGFALLRPLDKIYVYPSYYCEVNGDFGVEQWFAYQYPDLVDDSPLIGEEHVYICSLNTYGGEWCFRIDGDSIETGFFASSIWESGGSKITFSGEVGHLENDMPGITDTPVVFSELWYMQKYDNHYQPMIYHSIKDHWGSDDDTEWGFEWDTISITKHVTEIRVWDNYPLQF